MISQKLDLDKNVVVYEPNMRKKLGFFATFGQMAKDVYGARELIWQLFKRDFFAIYRKSVFGIGWIFIGPIFGILSWVFMNATGILKPGDVGIPYPAYVLLGTTLWGLFMGFYSSSAETLNAGNGFIMQVKYPHEALFVKQILQQLANFTTNFFVMIVALLLFRVIPSWHTIFLPIYILPMFFLASAIGLFVSVTSVVMPEIRKICDIVMGAMIFLTPIIYATNVAAGNGLLTKVITWNPLTYLVGSVRDVVAYGYMQNPTGYYLSAVASFIVFLISLKLFYVSEHKVIEKMF
jgi:lipopolysaccharide transport system permease protein